jgi:hypothetical protein
MLFAQSTRHITRGYGQFGCGPARRLVSACVRPFAWAVDRHVSRIRASRASSRSPPGRPELGRKQERPDRAYVAILANGELAFSGTNPISAARA